MVRMKEIKIQNIILNLFWIYKQWENKLQELLFCIFNLLLIIYDLQLIKMILSYNLIC